MKQMPLHKAGVSQWWTYALTLVYSTLPPLPTPPRQHKTRPNINAGWCCSAIGDVGPITVSDYAIHAPNCTLNNILNGSKLMGGLLQKIEQECCRVVAGDATINRVLEVHRSQSATCNHTATVIVGVMHGYSGNAETSLCLCLRGYGLWFNVDSGGCCRRINIDELWWAPKQQLKQQSTLTWSLVTYEREGNNQKIYAIAPVEKDKAYVTISQWKSIWIQLNCFRFVM